MELLPFAETCFRHSLQCMRLHVGMSPWSQISWTLLLYNVLVLWASGCVCWNVVFCNAVAQVDINMFCCCCYRLSCSNSWDTSVYGCSSPEISTCAAASCSSYTLCVSPTWCGFNSVSTWLVWCGTIFIHKIQTESVITFIIDPCLIILQ